MDFNQEAVNQNNNSSSIILQRTQVSESRSRDVIITDDDDLIHHPNIDKDLHRHPVFWKFEFNPLPSSG